MIDYTEDDSDLDVPVVVPAPPLESPVTSTPHASTMDSVPSDSMPEVASSPEPTGLTQPTPEAATTPLTKAAPEEGTDLEETPPEEVSSEENSGGRTPYARRRALATSFGVGILALAAVGLTLQLGAPDPTTPDRADAVPALPSPVEAQAAQATFLSELERAEAHQAATGSFVGFTTTLPEGKVAAGTDMMVLSAVIDGVCTYSGVIPGNEKQVLVDDTGEACTDTLINEAQVQLDTATSDAIETSQAEGATLLSQAAENIQFYAMNNFVGGVPSFEGLPTTAVDGVEVASNSGSSVVLTTSVGGSCQSVDVTTDSVSVPAFC